MLQEFRGSSEEKWGKSWLRICKGGREREKHSWAGVAAPGAARARGKYKQKQSQEKLQPRTDNDAGLLSQWWLPCVAHSAEVIMV